MSQQFDNFLNKEYLKQFLRIPRDDTSKLSEDAYKDALNQVFKYGIEYGLRYGVIYGWALTNLDYTYRNKELAISDSAIHSTENLEYQDTDLSTRRGEMEDPFKMTFKLLRNELKKIPEVESVYVFKENENLVHVWSILSDYSIKTKENLFDKEFDILGKVKDFDIDFHIVEYREDVIKDVIPSQAERIF